MVGSSSTPTNHELLASVGATNTVSFRASKRQNMDFAAMMNLHDMRIQARDESVRKLRERSGGMSPYVNSGEKERQVITSVVEP